MKTNGLLSDRCYDTIKWIATIALPAALTLITVLNAAWKWNLPIEAIDATISAVIAFMGALMGFSTGVYNKKETQDEYSR